MAAAILTFLTWGVHTFVGTPSVAGPLLESSMDPVAKYTNYYCWHGVTVVLAVMAGGYLYAALMPEGRDVAVLVTIVSAGFCLLGIGLVIQKKQTTKDMPQWVLFAIISAVAALGL
jgi:hypothetical protein